MNDEGEQLFRPPPRVGSAVVISETTLAQQWAPRDTIGGPSRMKRVTRGGVFEVIAGSGGLGLLVGSCDIEMSRLLGSIGGASGRRSRFTVRTEQIRPLRPCNAALFESHTTLAINAAERMTTLRKTVSFNTVTLFLDKGLSLPKDVSRHVASFLIVKPVDFSEVKVVKASSDRGDFPLVSVLGSNPNTWWISANGSMKEGRGEEYLEFKLSPNGVIRRLSLVGLSIPPMPYGPLSVRLFTIQWSTNGREWSGGENFDLEFETMDVDGMQTFELPSPIDAAYVRLVFLVNAAAAEGSAPYTASYDCVGLLHVRMK